MEVEAEMPTKEDVELVRMSLSGDRQAFGELVERYKNLVYGSVLNRVGDFDQAEDLAQDVFIEAYVHLAALRKHAQFSNWLCGIAQNLCNRWLEGRRREREMLGQLTSFEEERGRILMFRDVSGPETPEERYSSLELREAVWKAVGELPGRNREVMLLFYLNDMSHAEIGTFLGIAPSTVLTHLQNGRERLRHKMASMFEEVMSEKRLPRKFTEKVVAALPLVSFPKPNPLLPFMKWGLSLKAVLGMIGALAVVGGLTGWMVFGDGKSSLSEVRSSMRVRLATLREKSQLTEHLKDGQDGRSIPSGSGAITGKVMSEGGVPLSDVLVKAEFGSGHIRFVRVTTDQNGVYRMSDLADGMYYVFVRESGSPSVHGRLVAHPEHGDRIVRVREGETTEGVDFLLVPGRSVSGRVMYREMGTPAAGVPITLTGQERMDVVTDEEGGYVFTGVPPGRYTFWTDLDGYAVPYRSSFEVTIEEDLSDLEVSLIRKGTVSVVVRDEEGRPIPGAEVRYYGLLSRPVPDPRTDEEGRCRFEDVRMEEQNPTTLWVDHPEHAFAFLLIDPIQGGEDREIEVAVSRGGTLEGRVTDWAGKPVSGARVRVRGPGRFGRWHPYLGKTAFTDENGAYRVEHLPPNARDVNRNYHIKDLPLDALKVVVDHEPLQFMPALFTVKVREGEVTRRDVSVRPGGTLMGQVVDGEGYPVKGVGIGIRPVGIRPRDIRTDEDGFYRVEYLSPGEYKVWTRTPYDSWHSRDVKVEVAQVVEGEVARVDMVMESD